MILLQVLLLGFGFSAVFSESENHFPARVCNDSMPYTFDDFIDIGTSLLRAMEFIQTQAEEMFVDLQLGVRLAEAQLYIGVTYASELAKGFSESPEIQQALEIMKRLLGNATTTAQLGEHHLHEVITKDQASFLVDANVMPRMESSRRLDLTKTTRFPHKRLDKFAEKYQFSDNQIRDLAIDLIEHSVFRDSALTQEIGCKETLDLHFKDTPLRSFEGAMNDYCADIYRELLALANPCIPEGKLDFFVEATRNELLRPYRTRVHTSSDRSLTVSFCSQWGYLEDFLKPGWVRQAIAIQRREGCWGDDALRFKSWEATSFRTFYKNDSNAPLSRRLSKDQPHQRVKRSEKALDYACLGHLTAVVLPGLAGTLRLILEEFVATKAAGQSTE
ncbi:unnamed protein product [Cyprideis torosa]|uniref:Uncharacterized protein n=1 Tax=Cyprideis torosa TaxID=163714 RepID=A0A7R8ZMW2_9CRUS|nr:unnamed protein product [Cyprideis torosa]CAG0896541.1 unnamed protein product [Cyprideis torosa]